MISLLPAQRRAEEFAELIEADDDRLSDDVRARHRELLATVSALRDVEHPVARPEFVAELRSQLMVEADLALSQVDQKLTLPTHPRRHRDRRLAVIGGTVALLGATTSVAVAAQGALPGDTLYPVKRVIEGAQSSLTLTGQGEAETVLDQASGRLSEVEALARQIDAENANQVPGTLDDFADQADHGANLVLDRYADNAKTEPVRGLGSFVNSSMAKLVSLDALLPAAATDSLNRAARVLSDINERITSACPECETTVLEVPNRLFLALRSSDNGPQVAPTEAPAVKIPEGEPNQSIDPNDVTDIPENLLNELTSPKSTTGPNKKKSTKTPIEDAPKAVKKTVDKLGNTVDAGTDVLLGEDGLLSPLDPLLDSLLGRNGSGN